jgi:biopolymer transport protein ExbB
LTVATALFASSLPAFAQKAAAPVQEHKHVNLIELSQSGGPVMYILFLFSVVMVAMALTLLLTLRRRAVVTDRFMSSMESMVRAGDIQGLSAYSGRHSHRMAAIVQQTADFILQTPQAGMEEVRELVQTEGSRQVTQLTSRVTYLADIGAISPLVGLLGTVIGMTQAFFDLAAGKEGVQQLELTSGISHALITTAGGLVVAIPALVLYALFRGRALKLGSELETAATHFILELQMYSNRVRQAQGRQQQPVVQQQPTAWAPPPVSMSTRDLQGI